MSKQTFFEICDAAIELSKGKKVRGWRPYLRSGKPLESYFNKRIGWVIKRPAYTQQPLTPPSVRVPTIELEDGWVAQPIVRKVDLKKAVIVIRTKLIDFKGTYPDLHWGNVGWHKGKAVMFDW
jgi:hypothetical protein